ncbi:hypothetical protein [Rhodococcus sp. NPDC049939]
MRSQTYPAAKRISAVAIGYGGALLLALVSAAMMYAIAGGGQ